MLQRTMKALLWKEDKGIDIVDAPVPKITKPTDAIVRVTLSTICASDIHIVGGHTYVQPPQIIGHEFCGEVVELGSAVTKFNVGDKVAVSCLPFCGDCYFCQRGLHFQCLDPDCTCFGTNMGELKLDGCQAEYIRVPHSANTMYKIPDGFTEEDMLFVGDILSTGYFATEKGNIQPGDTVLIIGAGPVGMCAAITTKLWGPSKIIISDRVQSRLDVCLKEGIVDFALNPDEVDVTEKCRELTDGLGPDVVLECIGLEPTLVQACQAVRMGGNVVTIGVYEGPVTLPMADIWFKNISISMGFVPMNRMPELIKLIQGGRINTKFLMTHRAPLNDIVKGYDVFGNKKDNCLKWVVTPYEK
ncbi:MAG TPA: Zn-dependent alcohol dehydrogenase [Syntrophaceticus sp.]|uniref:Theronine dehydrogenase-like Zn-dependent dehydrogenase n=1 Tax=Syntrophaceticus schinkii TaxID=499207 RepID=A0A0B7MIE0_9FIRM|nr:Zn-dependent alcohol dehydrogenase [Syntrophaceticus schinkii]CEO87417.1 Theronine dehydrogenase-like Zn-dependent dehydrogenase [Syntrophaceticus schinkii]HHY30872.1 Zn-dependent alcohol dehydrogenase [Syntrophaceticus sp.]